MLKKFIILLALTMSFSLSAFAKEQSSSDGFLNLGVNLGISTEATLKDFNWDFQYGKMLSEQKSVVIGLTGEFNSKNPGIGFHANYEYLFSTEGQILPGAEFFVNLGITKNLRKVEAKFDNPEPPDQVKPDTTPTTASADEGPFGKPSKFGLGFGGGGFVKIPISEKRTAVFKYGIRIPIQALNKLEISSDVWSLYLGMELRYHFD